MKTGLLTAGYVSAVALGAAYVASRSKRGDLLLSAIAGGLAGAGILTAGFGAYAVGDYVFSKTKTDTEST